MTFTFTNLKQLPDDALVRVSQLAHNSRRRTGAPTLLNINEQTVFRLIRSGKFPKPIKLGRMSLFRLGDVRAWLAAQGKEGAK